MNSEERSSNSSGAEEMHIPERELFAFICAVEQLFGPEQAKLSMEDWLAEFERMDAPPDSSRDWRAVSIAAATKLKDVASSARISP
ncbi:MAG: hypothetical protein ACJ74Y_12700 [Bryobacteraceae bacterium]